eukprot:TRINITY_DN80718_c0_g1_i1.p1 TRINITY_DN80718_c0_g1~~TRINITY_DN80718_c0_g1_i1.p1  ORF type:complete len:412 (+),score=95.05 TRINITY_DN80718_c0_g1_i1:82-1317(+)
MAEKARRFCAALLLAVLASVGQAVRSVSSHTATVNASFEGDWEDLTKTFGEEIIFTSKLMGSKSGRSFKKTDTSIFWKGRRPDGTKLAVYQVIQPNRKDKEFAPLEAWKEASKQVPYAMPVEDYRLGADGQYAYVVFRRPSGFKVGGLVGTTYMDLQSAVAGHAAFPVDSVRMIMAQTALAIRSLHRRNMIHTDINLGNVFLSTGASGNVVARLADLRFSVQQAQHGSDNKLFLLYEYKQQRGGLTTLASETDFGTKGYRAPVFSRLAEKGALVNVYTSVDWWAWGMSALGVFSQMQPEAYASRTNFDDVTTETVKPTRKGPERDFVDYRYGGITRTLEEDKKPEVPAEFLRFLKQHILLPQLRGNDAEVNFASEHFDSEFWQDPFWQGMPWEELQRQAGGDDSESDTEDD